MLNRLLNEWLPLQHCQYRLDQGMFTGREDRPGRPLFPGSGGIGDRELLPRAHIRSVLGLVLEALTGRRPMSQVQGLLGAQLHSRLRRLPQVPEPLLALRTVYGFALPPSAYEVWGTAQGGPRTYAVTARFELGGVGWRCTAFELLLRQD